MFCCIFKFMKNKLLKMLVNGQATFFLLKFIRFRFASAETSSAPVLELTFPSLCLMIGASKLVQVVLVLGGAWGAWC